MKSKPKVTVIVGPTASGKSELAISIAKKFSGEIVSADSRQVYRGMDIGTAKPELVKKNGALFSRGVRHHLLDIRDINQTFTAKEFKDLAEKAIKEILNRGKLPIVVGGTGLYIKALTDNLNLATTPPNEKLRKKLQNELNRRGVTALYERLVCLDPEAAYIVDRKNPRRVIRALEIALTQKSSLEKLRTGGEVPFVFLQIGLRRSSEILKKKIERRAVAMVSAGLVKEVKNLVKKYSPDLEPLSAIGYREICEHLQGKIPLAEAVRKMQRNTWRYAKKQMAWFARNKRVRWVKKGKEAEALVRKFLARSSKHSRGRASSVNPVRSPTRPVRDMK